MSLTVNKFEDSNFLFRVIFRPTPEMRLEAFELFPNLSEVVLASRVFESYKDCISSCKALLNDLKMSIDSEQGLQIDVETNPDFSLEKNLISSPDWEPSEIIRLWLFDPIDHTKEPYSKASIFFIKRQQLAH